jgi:glycosyltransferase involved in cell wall biosynthesis
MKISIITVNRNNVAGLTKTLDGVREQTFRDFEHIVIDGGSTDGSADQLRARAEGLACWVSEPDAGIYNAMNKGLRMARGEYVQFLNSGDWLASPQVLARVFGGDAWGEDLLYGNTLRPDQAGGTRECPQPEKLTPACFFIGWGVCHQAIFYKRELFDALGSYDETLRIIGDWDFTLRAVLSGRTTRHFPFPVVFYDAGGISASEPELLKREREIVLKRHLPGAIYRDYESMQRLDAECQRLTLLEKWLHQVQDRNLFVNYAMMTKWAWDKLKRQRSARKGGGRA